ncbi:hypothetical protein [Actinomadura litoris]|uniref:Uncharacterized protein n=1 Tax=Actinomadura litoris TaxID=2678616 RepID=A0A7K1LB25_9ACTN|nr:hypothetical protein [Actinomadura litoris]MUN41622.1 hypothetical protein [Actinomadura litoris]
MAVLAVNLPVRRVLAVAVIAVMVCGACDRTGDNRDLRQAVQTFVSAVQRHDGPGVCGALAPDAAESLESGGKQCAAQVTGLDLGSGAITGVQVWGERAQAHLSDDTVFLARFPGGWKVTAAGCEPQPKGPYDCEVEA